MTSIGGLDVAFGARMQVVRTNVMCLAVASTGLANTTTVPKYILNTYKEALKGTVVEPDFLYLYEVADMDGSFATSVTGQAITITRSGGADEPAGAQSCTIANVTNPTVTDSTGTGLQGANLTFYSISQNASVGANGTYNLSLETGMHNLTLNYGGFAEITGTFNLTTNASLNLTMWKIKPTNITAKPIDATTVNVTVTIENLESSDINATMGHVLIKGNDTYPQNEINFNLF